MTQDRLNRCRLGRWPYSVTLDANISGKRLKKRTSRNNSDSRNSNVNANRTKETTQLLREQMEREQCQQFVRSAALASGLSDREPPVQMTMITLCSDPESGIRQRLRAKPLG